MRALGYLADADLMSFFAELQGDIEQTIFSTAPDQRDERERLYFQRRGIVEVVDMMRMYAHRAEEIVQEHSTQSASVNMDDDN